jgi:hypothetical protein
VCYFRYLARYLMVARAVGIGDVAPLGSERLHHEEHPRKSGHRNGYRGERHPDPTRAVQFHSHPHIPDLLTTPRTKTAGFSAAPLETGPEDGG